MTDDRPVSPAGQWPDASLRPAVDAPPIEWARFYRDRCGWIVLPTAGPRDVLAYAVSLHNEATADYAADHGGDVPEDVSADMWDHARKIADATLGSPIGYLYNAWTAKVATAADVTDEMLRLAWEPLERSTGPRAEADQRGIAILPNRSACGLPVCLVDVDPRHGGDNEGEWGMGLPGPKASTPGGGVHTLMLATGKETASADLGPGVDVVAGGGTTIPVPAGSATPGRRWLRWDAPVVAPDALRRRGRRKAPPRPGEAHPTTATADARAREPGDDFEDGRGAALVAAEVGDGERNYAASVIVGILARPRACPPDFVHACLVLLAEHNAADLAPSAATRSTMDRWRVALTRGPRDADFAAEVLGVWAHVRDTSRIPWSTGKTNAVARSLWKTCDCREAGNAGAEDYGVGPVLGTWPSTWAPLPAPPPPITPLPADTAPATPDHAAQEPRHDAPDAPDAPPPYPPPPPEQAAAAVAVSAVRVDVPAQSRWRGGIDPRVYLRTLGEQYTDDDLAADEARSPIRIDEVCPAIDFVTGLFRDRDFARDHDRPALFHGWGSHLGRDLGGLAPRDFRVIGAAGAGAGKTWFEGWLAHGLAIATAGRILGMRGFEDAPYILPVWLTEMPKPGELFLRAAASHIGIPMDVVTEGVNAASSPRVAMFASRLAGGWTPDEIVTRSREMLHLFSTHEQSPFAFARRHVIRTLAVTQLPRVTRRHGVAYDHRGGVGIIDHMADAIDVAREDLARIAGVTTDKVLPLALVDPGQRFIASTESSEKRAIDALFEAIRQTLCMEIGAAVIATSDTTKAAAREASSIDMFLSRPAGSLGADIFAGSQAIQHQADCIALQAEPTTPGSPTTRTWVRIFKSRAGGAADVAYPFTWEMGLGRFVAGEPEPLRPPPPPPDRQQQQQRGQYGAASPAPAPLGVPKILPGYTRTPREHSGLVD